MVKGFEFIEEKFSWLLFENPLFELLVKGLLFKLFWFVVFKKGLFTEVVVLFERKGFAVLLLLLFERKLLLLLLIPLKFVLLLLMKGLLLLEVIKGFVLLFWLWNLLSLNELVFINGLLL